jgi:hypothetical protein
MSSAALGNTYASICLNVKDPRDMRCAALISGMDAEEKHHLNRLPIGWGVVKLQDRWQSPFLVRFDPAHVEKGFVDDATLRALLSEKRGHSGRNTFGKASAQRVRHLRFSDDGVETDGMALLLDCVQFPDDGVRPRYLRLGFSIEKGQRLKTQLVEQGLLESSLIPIGRTRRVILRLSSAAREMLKLEASSSVESVEHEFWKRYYAARFEADGYQVELEAPRAGGRVDVLARRGDERVGVEIETGSSDVRGNVANCLRSRFDRLVVVATSEGAQRKIEGLLADAGVLVRGRVSVVLRDGLWR